MPSDDHSTTYHAPVLVEEVLEWLDVGDAKRFVDGTAGGGGHTEAILEASAPTGEVVALDRDPQAVAATQERLGDHQRRLTVVRANYSDTRQVLDELGWSTVDGWLIDAGVSSHQLDSPGRGFSFRAEGPLDMTMGPGTQTVAELLDSIEIDELARVLREYGEVARSWPLARAIVEARRDGTLQTTTDLAALVESRRPRRHGQSAPHPATTVFQALRIAVNRELEHLEAAVDAIPEVVSVGGRAVVISFHSLEDRIVKHGFRHLADPCTCPPDLPICGCGAVSAGEVLTRSPVTASQQELQSNPRARSAKLRAFLVRDESSSEQGPATDGASHFTDE